MALKFNTFRANRYLRSKFVEGKFLLASEATDLELEILDLLREQARNMLGDVAVGDAWKVERLSATQLLIKPGEAWFKGLPFSMRGGKDQLVSGAVLSIGTVPLGVTVADDASGDGKVLTFGTIGTPNGGDVTPSNTYRMVITAREELITDLQDEFLQNANLTESTQQKVRLVFQLNILPEAIQNESPIPYRDETSVGTDAGLTPTNFPDTGNDNQPNFVNQIVVTPAVGSGDLVSLNSITGAEQIDGRDLELIINNPVGVNPIPDSPSEQSSFSHGILLDSNGSEYHINFVTNDTVGGRVKIVIDKEYQQADPVIDPGGGRPYTLLKRDVYVTDDINGVPTGKVHWPIATLVWSNSNGVNHDSSITDLRTSFEKLENYTATVDTKFSLHAADGGTMSYVDATSLLTWSADIALLNPHGPAMSITADSLPIVDGGSLMYDLKLSAGGALELGTVAVNITSAGTSNTVDPVALNTVRVGNIIVDSGGVVAEITAISDVTNVITTSTALSNTGAATIYLDSYGPGKAPLSSIKFCLASRKGAKVYVAGLELEDGESGQIGDGASQELLTFVGSTGDADDSPNYTSEVYVSDGDSLVVAISALDAALNTLAGTVTAISWKAPVANFAALPAVGNVDGDVRLVLDTRVAYHWDNGGTQWLPLTGTGGGIKIIGGGTVAWDDVTKNVTFTSDMYLEKAGLAYTDNTIPISESPINLPTDKDVAYVEPNLTTGGGNLSVTVDSLANVPLTAVIIARRDDQDSTVSISAQTLNELNTTLFSATSTLADRRAQQFTAGATDNITRVRLMLNDSLTVTGGTLRVEIQGDNGFDEPDGIVAAFVDIDPTTLPNTPDSTFQDYVLSVPVPVSSGTQYFIVFRLTALIPAGTISFERTGTQPITDVWQFSSDSGATWGGPNLTLDAAFEVLSGNLVSDVIVGSSSMRLKSGESKELYEGLTDQEEDKLYGQKSSFFRSDNPLTWTGSDFSFTTDIVLEMLKDDGTEQSYTVLAADSPIAMTAGQYAYLTVDRTQNSQTLSFTVGAAPAEAAAGSEVVIFGKRQDVSGVGYLHLPFHKQVLEPGQTVRLGASGAGGGAGNPILETLKNRMLDSTFEAVTPQVFTIDKDTLLDGASTGAFSLVTQNFEFTAAAETMVTVQMLDATFLASGEFLAKAELLAFWDLDNIDTGATYEVSRNGGNEWQAVTMDRVDTTDLYRGFLTFADEAANQSIDSQATSNDTEELNTTTEKYITTALTIANTTELREIDLDMVVNDSGALAGNMYVALYSDNAGDPDVLLQETNAIDVTSLITGTNTISLSNTVLLAGTYHLVVRTDALYDSVFSTGVDSVSLDSNSAGTTGRISSDGSVWSAGTHDLVYDAKGIEYDLRVRITSSAASNLEGTGILYDEAVSGIATGVLEREVFKFKAVADNLNEFTLTKFVPNSDLMRVFYVEAGQVIVYPGYVLSGQTVQFAADQFNNGGVEADVTLIFDQTRGGAFDNSDLNGLLMASNFLGSTDATIDKSSAGRGIFLRRPDGTLREITIDDSDQIVIYSV